MDYDSIDYFFDDPSSFHAGKLPMDNLFISHCTLYVLNPLSLFFFHIELDDILQLPCCNKQDAERITTQYIRLWTRFQGNG